MRKIGSDKESERKKKLGTAIVGIAFLALLVLGTFGYAFIYSPSFLSNQNNEIEDGQAINVGNGWAVRFGGQTFLLTNSPEKVKEISVDISKSLQDYSGEAVYIDSENQEVSGEIYQFIGPYASRVQEACYGVCERDLPEKDCSENLIVWRDSSEKKVVQTGNCVFIDGDLESVDAFLYKLIDLN